MVNYTNKYEQPKYVEAWAKFDEYDHKENTFSATGLLKPPRQHALYETFKDDLIVDISDLFASRYGTAIHASFEQIEHKHCIQEVRYRTQIVVDGKEYTLTGKPDLLYRENEQDLFKLIDIKSCSVYNYIFGDSKPSWIQQLSIYNYICSRNNINTNAAEICMVFTDWSSTKSKIQHNYPNSRIKCIPITLMGIEETEQFIIDRIRVLVEAKQSLPLCTDEELWIKESKWAIQKENGSRALKLCTTKEEAIAWRSMYIEKKKADPLQIILEERKGEAKRCNYCMARNKCEQYKKLFNITDNE